MDYGQETHENAQLDYGDETAHVNSAVKNGHRDESEEEADEDELADTVDDNDPPVLTVSFEIKIIAAKEILLKDGIPLVVELHKGEQKTSTP